MGSQESKQHAPKGQKHIAQATPWGNKPPKTIRPVRAKASIINAFALTGRIVYNIFLPRAGALGYARFGLSARVS